MNLLIKKPSTLVPPASYLEQLDNIFNMPIKDINMLQAFMYKVHENTSEWSPIWKNKVYPYFIALIAIKQSQYNWTKVIQIWQKNIQPYLADTLILLRDKIGTFETFKWFMHLPHKLQNDLIPFLKTLIDDAWPTDYEDWLFLQNIDININVYNTIPEQYQFYLWFAGKWSITIPIIHYLSDGQKRLILEKTPLLLWEALVSDAIEWDIDEHPTAYDSIWKCVQLLSLGTLPFRSIAGMKKAIAWFKNPESVAYTLRQVPATKSQSWLIFLKAMSNNNHLENDFFRLRNTHDVAKSIELLAFDLADSIYPMLHEGILEQHLITERNDYLAKLRQSGTPMSVETEEIELFIDTDTFGNFNPLNFN